MKALLIAEKPSLMRTIQEVYNKHKSEIPYTCDFLAQAGHLLTLKLPRELVDDYGHYSWSHLPFHPEDNGGWQYKVITGTGPASAAKGRYKTIKDTIKDNNYDFIIHAGDPDQEGQLLVDIVLKQLKVKIPIKRYWSNDTTETKVLDALKNLRDYTEPMQKNLLSAAYCRQHSDYRIGMNLSEAASLKMNIRAAIGRVKTVILTIVCEREDAIKNFVPKTVYGVKALYEDNFTGQLFNPTSDSEDKDKDKDEDVGMIYFDTEKEARDFIATLGNVAVVEKFEKKKTETTAPKLFTLANCQIASGKLGYKPDETLAILQSLYEKGYMSYPRTDCGYISSREDLTSMIKSAMSISEYVPYIKTISTSDIERVKNTKKYANDKELESHGHSALVPTSKAPDFKSLSKEQQDIYKLVCRQFIAIFLKPLVQEKTLLITDINGNKFKSTGKTLISEGYASIFNTKFTDMLIPEHKKGDELNVDNFELAEKTSKCPTHLTETDIIQICESPHKYLLDDKYKSLGKNLKIGTPATRASIIAGLITKDKYLSKKKSGKKEHLEPTEDGRLIYENLKFCKICRVDLTGEWELKLEKVRTGEMSFEEFERDMIKDTNDLVEDIKNASMTTGSSSGKGKKTFNVIGQCPLCKGDLISGTKGFFCSNWQKQSCKFGGYKKIVDSTVSDDEFIKLINGETITKKLKKGDKTWEQQIKYDFDKCSYEFVGSSNSSKESDYKCPKCNKTLTINGKLIKCSCGFSLWTTVCGKELTNKQLNNFFTKGSTGLIKGLKSKAGKSFDANIVLKKDKSGTEFKFED